MKKLKAGLLAVGAKLARSMAHGATGFDYGIRNGECGMKQEKAEGLKEAFASSPFFLDKDPLLYQFKRLTL